MNILPKKRWHVRTKDNIARVRRDEAKAAEEEKAKQDRAKLAEREARRQLLLEKSRSKLLNTTGFIPLDVEDDAKQETSTSGAQEHINFFKEVEEGVAELKQTNKEHDKEVKQEKEKYEKQIGYLTYLGQDTNEALGKKSWYERVPERSFKEKGEVNLKTKHREDPLNLIKKLAEQDKKIREKFKPDKYKEYKSILAKSKAKKRGRSSSEDEERRKRRKKHKSKKSHRVEMISVSEDEEEKLLKAEKQKKLYALRAERLKRETEEKRKSDQLLAKIQGEGETSSKTNREVGKQKYNSQFNPELAKQNYYRRENK
ncbi:unnamed protein product [Ceutorhynchus assimilis]|uniref:CBF1-interacting co-repressor CIR N-terminal domain-containing protein n=1 Tax=Ceutorhynchus assimilis TaxID=467358 RepID=A0A9N9MV36_9CUCU|nr:unnamed protein product [Ceutorhynchus assimilis]